jgi:2-polyprenyl-6-methoxyphenol hydroxylase-like FAD-dependent oxidoreductase
VLVPEQTEVLIAGGGPVGLATTVELGRRGVDVVVVEPRATVSHARPRCKTINVRTMEHLRRWGIAYRLRERAPLPVNWSQDIVFCTSLSGYELSRFTGAFGLLPDGDRFSELGQQAPQYVLEELLREVVDEQSSTHLVLGWRVTDLTSDGRGCTVTVSDESGQERSVTAEIVIGCEGARSVVRDSIGGTYEGELALRPNFGMVFEAPSLWSRVVHGPAVQYWTINDVAPALIGPIDLYGTWWLIALGIDAESGLAEAQQIIDGVAGGPTPAKILSTDPWTARMQLVDRVRLGSVFLAGDAAHLNPPFGGHGLNTGIGDAVDLGWKLAAYLDGWGGDLLLDSYEAERRPVHEAVIAAAKANMSVLSVELLAEGLDRDGPEGEQARRAANARIQSSKHAEFHSLDLVLDMAYEHSPVVMTKDDQEHPVRGDPIGDLRSGRLLGARLPHIWLGHDRSIYDELGTGFSILASETRLEEIERISSAARDRRMPLTVVTLPELVLRDKWQAELILVRPDQHVAWCGDALPADPSALIGVVCGSV